MANVSIDNVSKVYPNGFQALQDLTLSVEDGEFMVLVGPSGCGKTTALRMVAGLEEITAGTIEIGGSVVNDMDPKDRDIAMVFQNYALYPSMTVRDNIGFALKLRHMPREQIASRVNEALALLGLTDWADRKPAQLSGGQRQRVAMGRAIVREPSVFLMDEPLSNLDAKLRVQMRAEVARIQRRLGVATLYVTHDQVEAMTMGDRVAILSAGVLQQCDEPQVVYDHPRNLFVAGFMGSPPMNLFEGTIAEGALTAVVGSQQLALPASVLAETPALLEYVGKPVVLGIRPEDLGAVRPGDHNDSQAGCVLEGRTDLVEALGSEQLIHFTTDARAVEVHGAREDDAEGLSQGTINRGGAGTARIDARTVVRAGDAVRFHIDPSRLRFFDPETAEAIGFATDVRSRGERSSGERPARAGESAADAAGSISSPSDPDGSAELSAGGTSQDRSQDAG
ncbi:MAG TPA: sn-glycerol-3-phosphate ABC transporter ATP-binding protein UgpC [Solirubrobacteraceae bacterium]|jgi:multiple sugar transport system ATP-binding protein|nr:sn-glycerol-3-phosphate ABC transporter ATP-binding protein UgpC [Solirubrobacteraceae bacterium]